LFNVQILAVDYYWVGGTGIWSDIGHWVTSSGGKVFHFTAPTASDDVHFDINSFDKVNCSVTIDGNEVCRNLDWTGVLYNPTFTGDSNQSLRIYGSLTFSPQMTFSFAGKVYFESIESGKTITSNGKVFDNDIIFLGATGGWTLQDSLTTKAILDFKFGSLITNGKTVRCNRFNSKDYGNIRNLNICNSTIYITGADANS
jgi:hypothetical protein